MYSNEDSILGKPVPLPPPQATSYVLNPQPVAGFDREQLYLALFQVFDKDSSGLIDPRDLHEIALALNKDPEQGRSLQLNSPSVIKTV